MYQEIDLDKMETGPEAPVQEPDRQYYYMVKCRERVRDFAKRNGRFPGACVVNMGCQMNTEVEIEKAA